MPHVACHVDAVAAHIFRAKMPRYAALLLSTPLLRFRRHFLHAIFDAAYDAAIYPHYMDAAAPRTKRRASLCCCALSDLMSACLISLRGWRARRYRSHVADVVMRVHD